MKKLFLFLSAGLIGLGTIAAPWNFDEDAKTLTIPYNEWGTADPNGGGSSIQCQGGTSLAKIKEEPVYFIDESTIGDMWKITFKGTAPAAGKMQICLVDEAGENTGNDQKECVAGATGKPNSYFWQLSDMKDVATFKKGDVVEFSMTLTVNYISNANALGDSDALNNFVFAFEYADGMQNAEFSKNSIVFTDVETFDIQYTEAYQFEGKGLTLTNGGAADVATDGNKFEVGDELAAKDAPAGVAKGKFLNVTFKAKALNDITTLMYGFVAGSQEEGQKDATKYHQDLLGGYMPFIANVKANDQINKSFSMPIAVDPVGADATFKNIIFANDPSTADVIRLDNVEIKLTISDKAEFAAPTTPVDGIAPVAFEVVNGMVYSAGTITVVNALGQVFSFNQELNVAELPSGVYFISAEEGSVKFVK